MGLLFKSLTKNSVVYCLQFQDGFLVENTHSADKGRKDNLVHELGRIFFQHVNCVMNEEITNNVEVEIEINKTE